MFKRLSIAVAAVAIITGASGVATARAGRGLPLTACYYGVLYQYHNQAVSLGEGYYITLTLSVWQVPVSGCTQWAGHDYGDSQTEVAVSTNYGGHFSNTGVDQVQVMSWASDSPYGVNGADKVPICGVGWEDYYGGSGWDDEVDDACGALPSGSTATEAYFTSPIIDAYGSGVCLRGISVEDGNVYVVVNGIGRYMPSFTETVPDRGTGC